MNRRKIVANTPGRPLLSVIASAFGAQGTDSQWLAFAARIRLEQEPDAAVAVVAALSRCAPALSAFPRPGSVFGPFLAAACSVFDVLMRAGWASEEIEAMCLKETTAQSVSANPYLAALVTAPLAEVGQRIGCLHLLIVLGILVEHREQEAFATVADATRKAKFFLGWRQLIADMPQPEEGQPWPVAFAQWASKSVREPAAYREFRRAVARAVRAVSEVTPSLSSAPAIDPLGRLVLPCTESVIESDDSWVASAADVERRPRPVARLVFDDSDNPAGPEPSQLDLACEAAIPPRHAPLPVHASRTRARLAAFKLMDEADRLRWSWDHLHLHEIGVLVDQASKDISPRSPRLQSATLAVLVLATGLPVTEVPTLSYEPPDGAYGISHDGLWRKPCYVHDRVLDVSHGLYQPHTGGLELALPALVRRAIALCSEAAAHATTIQGLLGIGASDAIAALSTWAAPLRSSHRAGRFTHGRLQRALGVELAAIVRDDAAVHLIAGTQADVPPVAVHYASFDARDLAGIYIKAVARLFGDLA